VLSREYLHVPSGIWSLIKEHHLHPVVDHFTIGLLAAGVAAEFFSAGALLLSRGGAGWLSVWCQKLRSTSLLLMIGGASAAVVSYFTGNLEASRLWDSMSPAAQQICSRRMDLRSICRTRSSDSTLCTPFSFLPDGAS
jgi:uncharacterized membrane protein